MKGFYKNESWLRRKYLYDNLSPEEIAKLCGVSTETIYVYLLKFKLRKGNRK